MRTPPHAHFADRRATPRRLVPRRGLAQRILESLSSPTPRFDVGDILKVIAADGRRHHITILGIHEDDGVDGMVYDGLPHHFPTTIDFLSGLRLTEVDCMPPQDIHQYRMLLNLPLSCDEVAA